MLSPNTPKCSITRTPENGAITIFVESIKATGRTRELGYFGNPTFAFRLPSTPLRKMPFDSESIFSDEDIGIVSLFGDIPPSSSALTPPSSAPQSVAACDSFLDDEKRVEEGKQEEEISDISLPDVFPPLPKYEDLKEVLPLVGAVLKLKCDFISSR
jgi:hypothetical protein